MNRLTIITLLSASLAMPTASATDYWGYAPHDPASSEISVQGSGGNNLIEVAIKLTPSTTPSLQGAKVTGVRCYLRTDYKQKTQKRTAVKLYRGSLEGDAEVSTVDNFYAGWNEVMFSEPVVLDDQDVWVGYSVQESQGNSGIYPIGAYNAVSIDDVYYLRPGRYESWTAISDMGMPLIEAIIEPAESAQPVAAIATITDFPLVVAPDAAFDCKAYVRNVSATPIGNVTITGTMADGTVTGSTTVTVNLPAYGSALVPTTMMTGSELSSDVPMTIAVTAIDGKAVETNAPATIHLYVTEAAYTRIPLIEEFTGMTCVNCPFMFYYLDSALEEFGHQYTYVAHHDGYQKDLLTQTVDTELLYLFNGSTYNPAVMYDRRVFAGQTAPTFSASNVLGNEQYLTRINEARRQPALAEVSVRLNADSTVTVSGHVAQGSQTADGEVYLSAYYVEDDLRLTDYFQKGASSDVASDAPDDFVEKFRHNGVIRSNLCTTTLGDKLTWDADGAFTVEYPKLDASKVKRRANAHVVAFVHRLNEQDLSDNYVLNSGDSRQWQASLAEIAAGGAAELKVSATADGHIVVISPVSSVKIYNATGGECNPGASQLPGVYVVAATLADGSKSTAKIAIR